MTMNATNDKELTKEQLYKIHLDGLKDRIKTLEDELTSLRASRDATDTPVPLATGWAIVHSEKSSHAGWVEMDYFDSSGKEHIEDFVKAHRSEGCKAVRVNVFPIDDALAQVSAPAPAPAPAKDNPSAPVAGWHWKCSNPSCRAIHNFVPSGRCPSCKIGDMGWSYVQTAPASAVSPASEEKEAKGERLLVRMADMLENFVQREREVIGMPGSGFAVDEVLISQANALIQEATGTKIASVPAPSTPATSGAGEQYEGVRVWKDCDGDIWIANNAGAWVDYQNNGEIRRQSYPNNISQTIKSLNESFSPYTELHGPERLSVIEKALKLKPDLFGDPKPIPASERIHQLEERVSELEGQLQDERAENIRLASCIIAARDELIQEKHTAAYHELYRAACPKFDEFEPWKHLESLAAITGGGR